MHTCTHNTAQLKRKSIVKTKIKPEEISEEKYLAPGRA